MPEGGLAEHELLRQSIRDFVTNMSPETEVRRLAKTLCTEAHLHVATENVHVHGGIRFTWEHPAHLCTGH